MLALLLYLFATALAQHTRRLAIDTMPLGKRTDCGDAKYAGLDVAFACDIVETLEVG